MRKQKTFRRILSDLLARPNKDERLDALMETNGYAKKDRDTKTAFIISLFELAKNGNSKAIDTLLTILNESAEEQTGNRIITVRLNGKEVTSNESTQADDMEGTL